MVDEAPSLDDHVVTRDERFGRLEQSLSDGIVAVAPISSAIPSRTVHEDAHIALEWWRFPALIESAIIRSFSDATLVPPDEPRSKTRERSTLRDGSIRSRATSQRMYSASETPHSDARARTRAYSSDVKDICIRTIMMAPSRYRHSRWCIGSQPDFYAVANPARSLERFVDFAANLVEIRDRTCCCQHRLVPARHLTGMQAHTVWNAGQHTSPIYTDEGVPGRTESPMGAGGASRPHRRNGRLPSYCGPRPSEKTRTRWHN